MSRKDLLGRELDDTENEIMDLYDDYCQILSLASPPLELVASPRQAVELARIGTDSMAELCARYPERFPAFIATPPMGSRVMWRVAMP